MANKILSASLEDYLEVIYNKITSTGAVKAIDISRELEVSRASVTEALNKLATKEYINYGRYSTISITDSGISKAKEIINKHKVIQSFFEQILNVEKEEATEIACKIEHVITGNILEKLSNFNKYCLNNEQFIKNFHELYCD